MIILIAIMPVNYALNHHKHIENLSGQLQSVQNIVSKVDTSKLNIEEKMRIVVIKEYTDSIKSMVAGVANFKEIKKENHFKIRRDIMFLTKECTKLASGENSAHAKSMISDVDQDNLKSSIKELKEYIEYVPVWILVLISISLGLGTMIGWKRIVVTIGEKVGKEHLTYVQGASAEIIAASTIAVSTSFGLPVSTTHVLTSGVAGSMVATKGLKNLRMKTVKSILIAWIITLPVTIVLAGGLFLLIRLFL
jgi:PiT family inorganic phosphate transporter